MHEVKAIANGDLKAKEPQKLVGRLSFFFSFFFFFLPVPPPMEVPRPGVEPVLLGG